MSQPLGREWIQLDWWNLGVHSSTHKSPVEKLLQGYHEVFCEGSGEINTFSACLHLKPDSRPMFHKATPVPFAMRETTEQELDRLHRVWELCRKSHIASGLPLQCQF